MTRQVSRARVVELLAAAIAVAVLVASGVHYRASKAGAATAAENLAICRQVASQIRQLRQRSQHASLVGRSLSDLGDDVEQAAEGAGLSRDSIVRIDPQAVRRVGDSDYEEQSTEVELLATTVRQIEQLVVGLAVTDSNLEVRTVRLRTPREEAARGGAELWLAELVLTQRIYAPKSARR